MNVDKISLICYSPTGTTKKSLQNIAAGINAGLCNMMDLTLPSNSLEDDVMVEDDLVIIGAPVYAGRVAPGAVSRFEKIRGNGQPAVVIVTYGNRAYEDALIELKDIAEKSGFIPVACGAVIGEHSYSSDEKQIAAGRPDTGDAEKTIAFGESVRQKLLSAEKLTDLSTAIVPGTVPEGDYHGPRNISPETDNELCTLCGSCAEVCPMACITLEDSVLTDKTACTMCSACVKVCPVKARKITVPRVLDRIELLFNNCQSRKEPEFFI